ncbi:hypothetical protein NPIL_171571 [Nephila pilipes]|uniref:RING-type domain-containing protein n=1 Tax=Nephila pilipes TaxID=299642 RepID=A0A8X6TA45_NEPPI|nr:hypothetical protein NPIL_171571 [Nephila pilipes]
MGEWVRWLERSIARDQSFKPILPFFFGFLLVPTLGQRPFTDGKQRHPGVSQFDAEYPEQLAEKGYGAFPYFLWKEYGIAQLYYLFLFAWRDYGPQSLDRWIALGQTLLDSVYAYDWPPSVFQAAEPCPICLQTMVWTRTTVCGHMFHVHCLTKHVLRHSNTCPLCRCPRPMADDDD